VFSARYEEPALSNRLKDNARHWFGIGPADTDTAWAWAQRPERVFVALACTFGLLYLLLMPPFQAPDEFYHFCRAYQVSEGGWFVERAGDTTGGYLPVELERAFARFRPVVTDPMDRVSYAELLTANRIHPIGGEREFLTVAVYSPVCYIPQAVGILLARALGLSVLGAMYLARLFALAAWILFVGAAIRITPIGKWAFFVISLLPMSLSLAASMTADSFTYALVAAAVALFLKLCLQDEPLGLMQVAGAALIGILLASTKPPFSLIFLVFLFVPWRRYRVSRAHVLVAVAGLAVCLGLTFGWSAASQAASIPAQGVSPGGQLSMMIRHPDRFAVALFRTFTGMPPLGLARQMIGQLGLGAKAPLWAFVIGWGSILATLLAVEDRLSARTTPVKLAAAAFVFGLFILIPTSLYLSFHPVGYESTIWVQGRYFIPILVTAIPLMSMRQGVRFRITPRRAALVVLAQTLVLSGLARAVLWRYYGV